MSIPHKYEYKSTGHRSLESDSVTKTRLDKSSPWLLCHLYVLQQQKSLIQPKFQVVSPKCLGLEVINKIMTPLVEQPLLHRVLLKKNTKISTFKSN